MKASILTAFLSSLLVATSAVASQPKELSGMVVGVADGDTLTILDASKARHTVRLAEIDAPEIGHGSPGQPFGRNAKEALATLCYGQNAVATVVTSDRYGRTVARVRCKGVDVNTELVRTGLAWVYEKYATDARLRQIQASAKEAKLGLWRDPSPVAPWEWRVRHHKPEAVAKAY